MLRNMTLKRVNIARYGRGADTIYKMTVGMPVEAVNLFNEEKSFKLCFHKKETKIAYIK